MYERPHCLVQASKPWFSHTAWPFRVYPETLNLGRCMVLVWGSGSAAVLGARLLTQVEALWGAINQRSILLPAAFVFLWQVWPEEWHCLFDNHCPCQHLCLHNAIHRKASQGVYVVYRRGAHVA